VQVLIWLNVARLLTMFSSRDRFDRYLFFKLVAFLWTVMCAFMHTTCFIACKSGSLKLILDELAERNYVSKDEDAISSNNGGSAWTIDLNIGKRWKNTENGIVEVEDIENKLDKESLPNSTPSRCMNSNSPIVFKDDQSRKLSASLAGVPLTDPNSCEFKMYSKACAIAAWLIVIINMLFSTYGTFSTPVFNNLNYYPIGLAPIGTYFFPNKTLPARIASLLMTVYVHAGWAFPPFMTFFVSALLRRELETVNRQFEESITTSEPCKSDSGSQFSGSIECFRIRHQKISRLIEQVDDCLCLCYSANIIGHVAMSTLMMYLLIWFPVNDSNRMSTFTPILWVLTGAVVFTVAVTGAILVNTSVSCFKYLL